MSTGIIGGEPWVIYPLGELAWKSLFPTKGEKPTLSHIRQTACRLMKVIIIQITQKPQTLPTTQSHLTFLSPNIEKQSLQETWEEKGTKI